jgi:hypothetical protein
MALGRESGGEVLIAPYALSIEGLSRPPMTRGAPGRDQRAVRSSFLSLLNCRAIFRLSGATAAGHSR